MSALSSLPADLQQRLRNELQPGEWVTWVGQPVPDLYMKPGFLMWLFFIPWTLFALFWMAAASGFALPNLASGLGLFPLFGLPFLLIGIVGLCTPLKLRRRARMTVYAITNQRAITIEGTKSITVRSYTAADIAFLERVEHKDGSGNLILQKKRELNSDGDPTTSHYGFFSIRDVRRVAQLLDALRQG